MEYVIYLPNNKLTIKKQNDILLEDVEIKYLIKEETKRHITKLQNKIK